MTLQKAWLGFPVAYVFAMCCDWFLVSGLAKGFAFRYLVKPSDSGIKIAVRDLLHGDSDGSNYVAIRRSGSCSVSGRMGQIPVIWLTNIPRNFIMALPLQMLIAGPLVRKVFRTLFPEGTVLA